MTEREELVVEIARELYDRFVMGGWEPQDAYPQIEGWLEIEREASDESAPTPETSALSAEPGMTPLTRFHHDGHWLVLSDEHEAYVSALRQRLQDTERERDGAFALVRMNVLTRELQDKAIESLKFELTAAQAELRTMREALRDMVEEFGKATFGREAWEKADKLLRTQGGESSDTLPRKEE